MDPAIAAALITAVGGLVGVLAPKLLENLKFKSIPHQRRAQLAGSWRGTTHQARGPSGEPIEVELITDISVSWRRVTTSTRMRGGGIELKSKAEGGFIWGDYLVAHYKNVNPALVNFGTVLLRLSSDGKRLNGRMVGYGARSEALVHGEVELIKVEK